MREAQLHPGRVPSLVGVGMGKGKEEHPFLREEARLVL